MSEITFSEEGWDDYLYWQTQDKKTLQKINKLLKSIPVTVHLKAKANLKN